MNREVCEHGVNPPSKCKDCRGQERGMTMTCQQAHERTDVEKLQDEIDRLKRMSVCELMLENLNVKHWVEEWESRCLKAEQKLNDGVVLPLSDLDEAIAWIQRYLFTNSIPDNELEKMEACLKRLRHARDGKKGG